MNEKYHTHTRPSRTIPICIAISLDVVSIIPHNLVPKMTSVSQIQTYQHYQIPRKSKINNRRKNDHEDVTCAYEQLSLSFQNGHVLSQRGHISVVCPNLPHISDLKRRFNLNTIRDKKIFTLVCRYEDYQYHTEIQLDQK